MIKQKIAYATDDGRLFHYEIEAKKHELNRAWMAFAERWHMGNLDSPVQEWVRRTFFPTDVTWDVEVLYDFKEEIDSLWKRMQDENFQAPDGIPF